MLRLKRSQSIKLDLTFEIYEGDVAKIQSTSFVGNEAFSDKELLKQLTTQPTGWLSWFSKSDRYAKDKFEYDLELLRSYYMDRGYINFQVDSTQVSLTPDKKHLNIVINVTEGDVYTFGRTKLSGQTQSLSPAFQEEALGDMAQGETFSRQILWDTQKELTDELGNHGYYFAEIRPLTEVNEETKQIHITFRIETGYKQYVRRIHVVGNTMTQDEVLRRELRQLEGAPVSSKKIKEGKERIERKGFSRNVEVEATKVAGTDNQVDLKYKCEEQRLGQFEAGLGYSQSDRLSYRLAITQQNFFGTGKEVGFTFDSSKVSTEYAVTYNDPYFTVDEVGLGFSGYYNETDLTQVSSTSTYSTDSYGGNMHVTLPMSEYDYLRFGLGYENITIKLVGGAVSNEIQNFINENGRQQSLYTGSASWIHSNLDRYIFPTKGLSNVISAYIALPGSTTQYFRVTQNAKLVLPAWKRVCYKVK